MRRIIRKFAQNTQTNIQIYKQRFQKQRPPYPLWIVGERGPIISYYVFDKSYYCYFMKNLYKVK